MPITGIDGQMISRTIDYARDVSAQLHRAATSQEYIAHHNKVMTHLKQSQVNELEQKEGGRVRAEDGKRIRDDAPRKKKKRAGTLQKMSVAAEDDFQLDDPTVGVSPERLLDIEV